MYKILLTFALAFSPFEGYSASNVWTAPFTLSATSSSMNNISPIAIDTHSNTIVGWLDGPFPTASNNIFSALLPAGTALWNTSEPIFSGTPPSFPSYPLLFTDREDNQTALWGELNVDNSTATLKASRRTFLTTGWPGATPLGLSGLTGGGTAHTGNTGNILAFVAVTADFSPPFTIEMSTLTSHSTSWTPVIALDQDNSSQPVLSSVVFNENAVLAWRTNMPTLSVHAMRYSFDNELLTPISDIPLPAGTTDLFNLFLASDAQGDVVAFFTTTDGISTMTYTSTLLSNNSTWSPPTLISNPSNSAIALSLGLSDAGVCVLLWGEITSLNDGYIFSANLPLSGIPTVTQLQGPLANASSLDTSSNVSVDNFGNAVAIWGGNCWRCIIYICS